MPPATLPPSDQLDLPMDRLTIQDTEERLVIALDFGTTFSGIGFAFASGDKEEVRSILEWPGEPRPIFKSFNAYPFNRLGGSFATQGPDNHLL